MAKKKAKEESEEPEEEVQDEPEDEEESKGGFLKKAVKVILGLALIIVGIGSYWYWWPELVLVIKGCLGAFVALIGLVVIMIGVSD
ncbi:hypothetical protein KY343_01195 [Candidatus Woesearchaeota archaeon]|nr:hypothetical protein [Candidatus Woesearchaeota archaeon]